MKYKLEILSPIHIGSGQKINPMEYIIDDRFHRIDMDALFEDKDFDIERFINSAKGGRLYLGNFAPAIGKRHIRYILDVSSATAKTHLRDSARQARGEVMEFIKTKDLAYIPGSSLKGAIRSALLYWILKNDPIKLNQATQNIIRARDTKRAADPVEEMIFGEDPRFDVLKALQVADTVPISVENLQINEVGTLTTRSQSHGWKRFRLFVEALEPETTFELNVHFERFLLQEDIARELKIFDKKDMLNQIPTACNSFAADFIEEEIKFFTKYNQPPALNELLDFYHNLKDMLREARNGTFLLHFAWGSSWHGITFGLLLGPSLLRQLRSKFAMGKLVHIACGSRVRQDRRRGGFWCQTCRVGGLRDRDIRMVEPFPKTRKIILEEDTPVSPLGWVKLEPKA